jgi:hypothetical protein
VRDDQEEMALYKHAVVEPEERCCGYDFFSMLKVRRLLYAWLASEKIADKPFLPRKGYIELAYSLLGVDSRLEIVIL